MYTPDCWVIYEAQERLDEYLDGREEAFAKAKNRYRGLSVVEKFRRGFLLSPKWDKMEDDLGIDRDFLDLLYTDKEPDKHR